MIIKDKKILVTGGAGFIGSNLVSELIDDNEIVVVDDLSMGKRDNLPKSKNLYFYEHTITDYGFMSQLLIKWDFDYVFLLAAVASVADTIERPMETHKINQDANIGILEIIRLNKLMPEKVLFASSAAVYGNNPSLPKSEASVISPLSPYAIDKYATERFVIDYGNLYGIPTVATRFFNVYGPKQNPLSPYSGVLSIIVNAMRNRTAFSIFGDGMQTRDFIYVKDVVDALLILITESSANGHVYNVACGQETTLNDVVGVISKISGIDLSPDYKPARIGDIKHSVADVSKIKELGFMPQYTLYEGMKEYLSVKF